MIQASTSKLNDPPLYHIKGKSVVKACCSDMPCNYLENTAFRRSVTCNHQCRFVIILCAGIKLEQQWTDCFTHRLCSQYYSLDACFPLWGRFLVLFISIMVHYESQLLKANHSPYKPQVNNAQYKFKHWEDGGCYTQDFVGNVHRDFFRYIIPSSFDYAVDDHPSFDKGIDQGSAREEENNDLTQNG